MSSAPTRSESSRTDGGGALESTSLSLLPTAVLEWVTSPLVARKILAAAGQDFEGSYSGNDVIGLCGGRLESNRVKVRLVVAGKVESCGDVSSPGPARVRRVVGGSSVTE